MINWWLIGLLSLMVVSWALSMLKKGESVSERVGRIAGILLILVLMYMSGIFTELWGVNK